MTLFSFISKQPERKAISEDGPNGEKKGRMKKRISNFLHSNKAPERVPC